MAEQTDRTDVMPAAESGTRLLSAIMFTDMAGYSALTQKNEALALELLETHRKLLRPVFPKYGGKEIKTIGDAFLVEFGSALEASHCAIEMQKVLVIHNSWAPPAKRVRIRIGIHVGDVEHRQGDVFGDAVNIASRIEPLARPGGICVSEDVARQVENKLDVPLQKIGQNRLKNIQLPVEVHEIALPWLEEVAALAVKGLRCERSVWSKSMRPWLVAGLLAAVAVAITIRFRQPATSGRVSRFTITLPAGQEALDVALSPDGTQLAYLARQGGVSRIYLRSMASFETRPVPGTEGAGASLFFSPDGQWIAFWADGKLKKVSVRGGSSLILCDAKSLNGGGSWEADAIYFSEGYEIRRVSPSGGTPEAVTTLDRSKDEVRHYWPQVLPGGKSLLYTVWTGPGIDGAHLELQSLETGQRRTLLQAGQHKGHYFPTGHLAYSRRESGVLMAVPFELQRLEVLGSAPVALDDIVDGSSFAVSGDGTLAYIPGGRTPDVRLGWVNRSGKMQPLPTPPRNYYSPSLSPDGRRLALESVAGQLDIVIYDLERGTISRLTSEGSSQVPVWTPDGSRIVYRATRAGTRNLFWKPVDGGGSEERLTSGELVHTAHSWTPDGMLLAFQEEHPETGADIWLLPLDGDRKPQPFLKTRFHESLPRFSPDGRWLAYSSDESGRREVYVQPFPGPRSRWQISTEGGTAAIWARSGRELFYRSGEQVMAVEITTQPGFSATRPRLLFEGQYRTIRTDYDVSPDGQRFLMMEPLEPPQPATQINVVLNWFEELRQRVPGN